MNKKQQQTAQDVVLLFTRLIVAAIFIYATYGKWQYLSIGAPGTTGIMLYLTWFLLIVEPLGAIAVLIGYLTRWAAAGLAIIMAGAVVILRFTMGTALFTLQSTGLDYNVLILASCLVLAAFGAGKWSLDARMKRQ